MRGQGAGRARAHGLRLAPPQPRSNAVLGRTAQGREREGGVVGRVREAQDRARVASDRCLRVAAGVQAGAVVQLLPAARTPAATATREVW